VDDGNGIGGRTASAFRQAAITPSPLPKTIAISIPSDHAMRRWYGLPALADSEPPPVHPSL
jgi:hypothetical protein